MCARRASCNAPPIVPRAGARRNTCLRTRICRPSRRASVDFAMVGCWSRAEPLRSTRPLAMDEPASRDASLPVDQQRSKRDVVVGTIVCHSWGGLRLRGMGHSGTGKWRLAGRLPRHHVRRVGQRLSSRTGVKRFLPGRVTRGCPGPILPTPFPHDGHPELLRTREGIILHIAPTAFSWTADRGQTWTKLDCPGTGYYPHAAQLEDGTILAVGHTGNDDPYGKTDQAITLVRLRLDVR